KSASTPGSRPSATSSTSPDGSAGPRLAIDAQEIAAKQLLESRLAPASLLEVGREPPVSVDAVVVGDHRPNVQSFARRRNSGIDPRLHPFVELLRRVRVGRLRKNAVVGADSDMVFAGDVR